MPDNREQHRLNMKMSIDQYVRPLAPEIADVAYDALTGRRQIEDMLTTLENVELLCQDGFHAGFPMKNHFEFHFFWRISDVFTVQCKIEAPFEAEKGCDVTMIGRERNDAEEESEWWCALHALSQARDSEGKYKALKRMIGMLYAGTTLESTQLTEAYGNVDKPS